MSSVAKGKTGEEIACKYLTSIGMEIFYRNYRCSGGEIDIIYKDKNILVFCEVKAKNGDGFGAPKESVTQTKQKRISNAALDFAKKNNFLDNSMRFDVLEIYFGINKVNLIKDAFEYCGRIF